MKTPLLAVVVLFGSIFTVSNQAFAQSSRFVTGDVSPAHPVFETYNRQHGSPAPPDPRSSDWLIRLGLTAGPVISRGHTALIGTNVGMEKSINSKVSATISAGFNYYKLDENWPEGGALFVPFKGGAKIWLSRDIFLHPEGGFVLGVTDWEDAIIYGATIGKAFRSGLSLEAGLEKLEHTRRRASFPDPLAITVKAEYPLFSFPARIGTGELPAHAPKPNGHRRGYLLGEFLGASGLFSLQWDQRFQRDRNDGFGYRAGLGYFVDVYSVPVGLTYLSGPRRSSLELGLGAVYLRDTKPYVFLNGERDEIGPVWLTFTAGYRLQSYNGFMLRLNNTVVIGRSERSLLVPGLSIGHRLR